MQQPRRQPAAYGYQQQQIRRQQPQYNLGNAATARYSAYNSNVNSIVNSNLNSNVNAIVGSPYK